MPDPRMNFAPCCDLMVAHTGAWRRLVAMLVVHTSSTDVARDSRTAVPADAARALRLLPCPRCTACFPTTRALAQHERIKHGVRSEWRLYVGTGCMCHCCKTVFSTRLRATAHLSDPRRNRKCRQYVLDGLATPVPPDELNALDDADRFARRSAQQAGLTMPLTTQRPKRSGA